MLQTGFKSQINRLQAMIINVLSFVLRHFYLSKICLDPSKTFPVANEFLLRLKFFDGKITIKKVPIIGDFTMAGKPEEIRDFNDDLKRLPHRYKIVIAGKYCIVLVAKSKRTVSHKK